MHEEQQNAVWSTLDRDFLETVARRGPEPLFATLSGAHLYGFASPDSDVDLRGAFLLPVHDLLRLRPAKETISLEDKTVVDLDWVAHDVRKFARLMTRHNGYVLEQLYSPLVVVETPALAELRELGRGCITRPTVRHYLGFYRGRRQRLEAPRPTVKHLLYAYRVLLTGIHLMRSGEVVANLPVLNERFEVPGLDGLVQRKQGGAEKMPLAEAELSSHLAQLGRLETELERAHEKSSLPHEPTTVKALDDFVVRLRLEKDGASARSGRLGS